MKSSDILDLIKLGMTVYAAKQVSDFLGFTKSKDTQKGEDSTADALSGEGKVGKAFNLNYWQTVQNQVPAAKQSYIASTAGQKAERYLWAKGGIHNFFNDDETAVETTSDSIKSVFEFSYVFHTLANALAAMGIILNTADLLGFFESFLNQEELELYIYKYIKKVPYLPQ